jgi:hypothetical protein
VPKQKINASAATDRFDFYCMAHPGTPSAVRRPRLFIRSGVWVALLGASIKDGIAGFGPTVELALSAFDVQYLNTLRRPGEKIIARALGDGAARESSRTSQARAA